MVSGFRRSPSFPTARDPRSHKAAQHLRSTSLPCRSHPLVAQLDDDVRSLRAWQSSESPVSPHSIINGMALIERLLASFESFLHLDHPHDILRQREDWTERLLDDFLRLADAQDTFRAAVFALRLHRSETQGAIRRRDDALLSSCIRSQRRNEREIVRLAAAVGDVVRWTGASKDVFNDAAEEELAGIISEVASVAAVASAAVFSCVAAASSSPAPARASRWSRYRAVGPLFGRRSGKQKKEEDEDKDEDEQRRRMEMVDECIEEIEEKSERVFRRLVNTRVTLLNFLTPSL